MTDPIDILIPLGPGSPWDNNELRYSLRSICQNVTGWRRIYIVGEPVEWLQETTVCKSVPHEHEGVNKEARIARRVAWAFRNLPLSDRVLFTNDDFVFLQPTDARTFPNYYKADLSKCARIRGNSTYGNSLRNTFTALRDAGHTTHCYDCHTPIVYERERFLALQGWWDLSSRLDCGLVVKSIYGNVHGIGGERIRDPLMSRRRTYEQISRRLQGRATFSINDRGLNDDMKRWLADRFPVRCPLETAP